MSEEEFFSESDADTFSDCPSDNLASTSVSEDNSSSKYSSDSDDVTIRPAKRQKTLVIDSDMERENETHGAGEDFAGVSGVTIERNNLQSVSEIIWGQPK